MNYQNQFDTLYTEYQARVQQLCLGYVKGNTAQAQDLVQEVFINVWNSLPKFRGDSGLQTWLYRITVNTCLLHLRRKKRQLSVPLSSESDIPVSMAEVSGSEAPYNELYQAIGQLAELDRLIIMMVLEEMDYDEIARIVDLNPATLRVKIHRIKKRLKKLLSPPVHG